MLGIGKGVGGGERGAEGGLAIWRTVLLLAGQGRAGQGCYKRRALARAGLLLGQNYWQEYVHPSPPWAICANTLNI